MINIKRHKWVIVHENKILSNNGFRDIKKSKTCVPKMFDSIIHAKNYMKRYKYINFKNYDIINVTFDMKENINKQKINKINYETKILNYKNIIYNFINYLNDEPNKKIEKKIIKEQFYKILKKGDF